MALKMCKNRGGKRKGRLEPDRELSGMQAEEFDCALSGYGGTFGVGFGMLMRGNRKPGSLQFLGLPLSISAGAVCP